MRPQLDTSLDASPRIPALAADLSADAAHTWLAGYLRDQGAMAGTIHTVDHAGDRLRLCAAINIPPPIQDIVREVPRGKGMAGLALARRAPVYTSAVGTCQTGVVRPRGRSVTSGAAVTLPVADAEDRIRAVVGVGYAEPRDIDDGLLDALRDGARDLLARI